MDKFIFSLIFFITCLDCFAFTPKKRIPLEGKWGLLLDTAHVGLSRDLIFSSCEDSILLPSTTDRAKKGIFNKNMTETGRLSREYFFEGEALYKKTITIPQEWQNTCIRLFMERTKPSEVYIDGKKAGTNDNISTPQQYDVSKYLTPGVHTLAILIDNGKRSVPAKVFSSSHAYSNDTQTNWNGIIGDFYLESVPVCGIEDVQVYPDLATKSIRVKISFRNGCDVPSKGELLLYVEILNVDEKRSTPLRTIEVNLDEKEQTFDLPLGEEAICWSEFSPVLYCLNVSLKAGKYEDNRQAIFGLRKFGVKGKQFAINDKITFLRGKHDACVFPLTGHTPMDTAEWHQYFRIIKQYGINHIRFHSWCPPEACFEAADREGVYLQPELPIWGNINVKDTALCNYLVKEGINILKTYGNHPSFVMFGLGNELSGKEAINMLIRTFKPLDDRHLYGSGSNNFLGFEGKQENEHYFTTCRVGPENKPQVADSLYDCKMCFVNAECAMEEFNTHARASFSFADAYDGGYLNHTYPNTVMNFSSANCLCDIPIISHETGQFQIYPDYDEIKKYTGVLKPQNMEVFKSRLERAGMGDQAHDFMLSSGKLAALLYRADIEMNLRTPHWGGFQLLDLQDYPGQGSAYVGVLNVFLESKGLISPEEWRNFCSEVVPLFRTEKFCWANNEMLSGDILIANYSPTNLFNHQLIWELTDEDQRVLKQGSMQVYGHQGELINVGTLELDVSFVEKAEKVHLNFFIEDTSYKNSYPLWIYPTSNGTKSMRKEVEVAYDLNENVLERLESGQKVLLFPDKGKCRKQTVGGLFQTDYWNYRMFKTVCKNMHRPVSPGTLGILTNPAHPVFSGFPTDFYTNWQWFAIIKQSYPLILDSLPKEYRPIIQVIDNVERNHKLGLLFEFEVGKGKLLVCMSDLKAVIDKPEVRQFYNSLVQYMGSPSFNPSYKVTPDELCHLFSSDRGTIQMDELKNISYE